MSQVQLNEEAGVGMVLLSQGCDSTGEILSGVNFFVYARDFGAPSIWLDRGVNPSLLLRIKVRPLLPHHSPLTPSYPHTSINSLLACEQDVEYAASIVV